MAHRGRDLVVLWSPPTVAAPAADRVTAGAERSHVSGHLLYSGAHTRHMPRGREVAIRT
jgi:hypothetical protein